ncbi:hypothetical protein ACHAAC_15540 [Aeromicrobium sp. CF4.19]|uniref:class III extradiol dioxygenase subunit B-like domain-containing protein n=1 Tax=Aeromicrobium sp. CF4.19 TaxID=3373082 RepID=UPI003EE65D79
MIVVVCPHPPLLVPALDPHALPEMTSVRREALAAVNVLVAAADGLVTVLTTDGDDRDERAGGSLAGHGVDVRAGGPDGGLGLAATIGAWLLDEAGWQGGRRYVGPDARESVEHAEALLVMADGSARRTERAPGHLDPRAETMDAAVGAALQDGDAATLASLDLGLADELLVSGAPALRALGAAVVARTTEGAEVVSRLRHDSAPFGVGYWVADWRVG